jgi:hypothetical protein
MESSKRSLLSNAEEFSEREREGLDAKFDDFHSTEFVEPYHLRVHNVHLLVVICF